jgi:hypothetical protein
MKVRPKPLTLEAFHWTADASQEADPIWAIEALKSGKILVVKMGTPLARLRIQTRAGVLQAERGDWIIRSVDGELYPCNTVTFERTYRLLRMKE